MPSVQIKRGTRAQIDAAAAASGLKAGEVYLITDENRLAVGLTISSYQAYAKQSESDPWIWTKLGSDVANSTTTLADVTGLSFTAAINTTFLIEALLTFQSSNTDNGIAVALDIPAGATISGQGVHELASKGAVGIVGQNADALATATTGVNAANANTPFQMRFLVAMGGTGGTISLQQKCEIASRTVTMKAGLSAIGYRAI